MANGAAALHLTFVPAPDAAVGKPSETAIGAAMANAVEFVGRVLAEESTPLRAATRALAGERIAAVATIWLDHFGESDDFRGLALTAGRRVLLERHGEALRQTDCSETAISSCIDELCGWIITIAGQVTATELAFRAN